MTIILQATWVANPGSEQLVRDALANLAPLSRQEPGNRGYTVYHSASEPSVFRIFEIYENQDAVTAHAESEHFRIWGLQTAIPELAERRREFFEMLDI